MTYIFHDDPTERTNNHYSGVNVVTMYVEKTNSITSPVHVVLVKPFVQCGETCKELDLIILRDGFLFESPVLKKIDDYQNMLSAITYHFTPIDVVIEKLRNGGMNSYAIDYIKMISLCTNPTRVQIDSVNLMGKQLGLISRYVDKMEDISNHYDQLNNKIEGLSDSLNQLRRMGAFN
ncbi:MAG: hypothetical protein IJX54_04700 [Oscillospiraceae bacterium]|nr:hypothetical protein [Oscillospiraceae bacterium]